MFFTISFSTPGPLSISCRLECPWGIHWTTGGGSPTAAHSSVTEEPAVTEIELEGLTIILGSAVKGKHKGTDTVWNYKPVQESNVFSTHHTEPIWKNKGERGATQLE